MHFPWINLYRPEQVDELLRQSVSRPQIIFKHSKRCNISSIALRRLEQSQALAEADYYLLDVIGHRDISQQVAHILDTWHESPQILLIMDGECVYDESHMGISAEDLAEELLQKTKG